MKIVASIEARMHSKRLPGKVLEDVCGHPVLWHIVQRVKRSDHVHEVVIATTVEEGDDPIAEFARENGIKCFRGSEDDVLNRLVKAHDFMQTDLVVEITGDSPFVDPEVIDETIELYFQGDCDYVSNTLTRSHPIGIRSQVFSLDLLKECEELATEKHDREHVTTFICRNKSGKYQLKNFLAEENHNFPSLRLTLDYPEDLEVTRRIYEGLYPKDPEFILDDVLEFLDNNPEIKEINQNCKQIYKEGA